MRVDEHDTLSSSLIGGFFCPQSLIEAATVFQVVQLQNQAWPALAHEGKSVTAILSHSGAERGGLAFLADYGLRTRTRTRT